jgi:hypothetical protein
LLRTGNNTEAGFVRSSSPCLVYVDYYFFGVDVFIGGLLLRLSLYGRL